LLPALPRHRHRLLHLAQAALGAPRRRQARPRRRVAPERRGLLPRVRRDQERPGARVIVFSAEFVKSATKPSEYPAPAGREVAFCGRSNVGKSSCLNALVQRKSLARVSRTPGRTRLINFFRVDVGEAKENIQEIVLADLPGYGYASGPKSET